MYPLVQAGMRIQSKANSGRRFKNPGKVSTTGQGMHQNNGNSGKSGWRKEKKSGTPVKVRVRVSLGKSKESMKSICWRGVYKVFCFFSCGNTVGMFCCYLNSRSSSTNRSGVLAVGVLMVARVTKTSSFGPSD